MLLAKYTHSIDCKINSPASLVSATGFVVDSLLFAGPFSMLLIDKQSMVHPIYVAPEQLVGTLYRPRTDPCHYSHKDTFFFILSLPRTFQGCSGTGS